MPHCKTFLSVRWTGAVLVGACWMVSCAHTMKDKLASENQTPASTPVACKEAAPTLPEALRADRPPVKAANMYRPSLLASVQIAAVGDVLPHTAVLTSARQAGLARPDGTSTNHFGYDVLFAGVKRELSFADIALANLESPVAPQKGQASKAFVFNAPIQLLEGLKAAGITLVSLANNHIYDQGLVGLQETLEALEKSPLAFVGAGRTCQESLQANIIEANGIRLAFLAAAHMFNTAGPKRPDQPCAALLDEKSVIEQAAQAKAQGADLVFLSVHWGDEYQTAPRQEDIQRAHRLLDGGVDGIVGHHPHVLQPVEIYEAADGRMTFVAYSLGNFISNQSRFYVFGVQQAQAGNPRDGVILRFKAVRKDYGGGQIKTELADLSVQPTWTQNNARERTKTPSLPVEIRVVVNDAKIRELSESIENVDPNSDPVKILSLKKQLELYQTRKDTAASILGEDLLYQTPSQEGDALSPVGK